ncbi:unnamed protein product [Orchesella dallaii]|uniref:Dehydrogenase/reductase SDR family member 12 n=1 Tax=Orchesella dallaii TaxID=48710 RepID=A0ABP1RG07_9HEXA
MSVYRNIVWYMKGLREYTKTGYEAASKNFNAGDLEVDLSNKTYLITGGNSGIGYNCAVEIARRKGTVHLVCRNEKLGSAAKNDIIKETQNEKVFLHIVDLSKPKEVIEFSKSFSTSKDNLNALINNAGCMANTKTLTSDNLDVNFATNTLGFYLLTVGLLELLSKSEDPRVLFVSSGGMLVQKLDYDDFNFDKFSKYNGVMAYAQNKRQQVVMCERFAKNHPEIFFASMHPGWADTPAVRSSMPDFYEKMKDKLRTAPQGADTLVWLAVSPAAKKHNSGLFFQDRTPVPTHLPLAWTHTSDTENAEFMLRLSALSTKFQSG